MRQNSTTPIRNRLLRALPPGDLEAVRSCLEEVDLEVRTVVVPNGRQIEYLHFIESGLASVIVASSDDEEIEIGHIGREGMTGSAACLGVSVATTRTFMQVGGRGWRLSLSDYGMLAADRPSLVPLLLRYVYTQQMQVSYSALANARYNLRECLARWLLMAQDRLESDELPLTHEFLSLMIGVRRAGVTGELTILESMGLVRATRGVVRIIDRERLLTVAGGCYGQPEAIYDAIIGAEASHR